MMNQDLIRKNLTFRNAYLLILLILLGSLPLSKYLASASMIALSAVWILEGDFRTKWGRLRSRPAIWIFLLLFAVHLAGMTWTDDLSFGFHDLKLKLPLLILPVVLGTIEGLKSRELRFLLMGFVLAVFIGTLVSLSIMLGFGPSEYSTDRETSLFISHIRFALMIDLAIFILGYYIVNPPNNNKTFSFLLSPFSLFLVVFLLLFKSLTGLVVLFLGGMFLAVRWAFRQKDLLVRWFIIVGVATLPVMAAFYLSRQYNLFYTAKDDLENLDPSTAQGNPYWHDLSNPMTENGWRVGLYQCETEMREAWNRISPLNYDGLDSRNQEVKHTLIRYLTSLGLRKDANGVSQLTAQDISLIEKGFASCQYRHPKRLGVRIYEIIWELDQYRHGANPSGHSVTQRLEYLKAGWSIFRDHPLAGVGTGDTQKAFELKYEELKSPLDPAWRLRAHNQFLSFSIAFGLTGLILILCALILPPFMERRTNSYFILMFFIAAFLSFLNEDTLETQAGVAFFAVFYALFVFAGTRDS